MRRRDLVTLLGGAAVAWPLVARAQQQMPLVAFLNGQTAGGYPHLLAAYKQGLNETGFVEAQNVTIEYGWADRDVDRLPGLAADFCSPPARCARCNRRFPRCCHSCD